MDLYFSIFGLAGVFILTAFFVWFFVSQSREKRILNIKIHDASLTSEELEEHVKQMAFDQGNVKRSNVVNWPIPRMNDNYRFIMYVYKSLNLDVRNMHKTSPAAEWLLDNFYIIEEQVKSIRKDLTKKRYSNVPVLEKGPLKGYTRVHNLALELVSHTDGKIDDNVLINYIKAYQEHYTLTNKELWLLSIMIRIALIEKLRYICEKIMQSRIQKRKADRLLESIDNEDQNLERLLKTTGSQIKSLNEVDPAFFEHLSYRIRKMGRSCSRIMNYIEQKLAKMGTTIESVSQKEHNDQAIRKYSIENCIVSLKFISSLDWIDIFESLSITEKYLRDDPGETYGNMDLASRNYYRNELEKLAHKYNVSETHVAKAVLELAKEAAKSKTKAGKEKHVGYYIIDKGINRLESKMGYKPNLFVSFQRLIKKKPASIYFGSIFLVSSLLILITAKYAYDMAATNKIIMAIAAGILVLIPATDISVNFVNWVISHIIKPTFMPKMKLSDGIPDNCASMIVLPALLTGSKNVIELIKQLEVHYLANKDKNLFIALLGDFKDSDKKSTQKDEKIIQTTLNGVKKLNEKYNKDNKPIFYFFLRERQYNEKQNKWMGWERKRGAIMEFNEMLLGSEETSYVIKSGEVSELPDIKYIITLDADTILPLDGARKLIGTMSHPVNKPIVDKKKGIVTDGYGLMQPRIGVDLESANKSLFSRIFAGEYGLDPYSNAVSDIYQDLFDEGIFTGKGIYDLKVFHNLLKDSLPDNTILSHDLLEGSYVRTGLVTDIELIDSYPSGYNSFSSRMHRWVRGDWQLTHWIRKKTVNRWNEKVKNPLNYVSRWKIFDNIRRSLVAPTLMLLIISGFCILPGSIIFWLLAAIMTQAFPLVTGIIDHILSKKYSIRNQKKHIPVISGLKATLLRVALLFVFLPFQAYLMTDAIIKTIIRLFITRKNMLEWVPAASVEKMSQNSFMAFWIKMRVSLLIPFFILVISAVSNPSTLFVAFPLFAIWSTAPFTAYYISRTETEEEVDLGLRDIKELRKLARKTWRYFEEFVNHKNQHLPPDNYQEDPPNGIAYRTSPTNIGLWLLSALAARDLGYIGTYELYKSVTNTINTVEKLDKWHGHLYNWYNTRSLYPLKPRYVSTVDSGNFVGYLMTLKYGLQDFLNRPVVDIKFVKGLRDTISLIKSDEIRERLRSEYLDKFDKINGKDLRLWAKALEDISGSSRRINVRKSYWKSKVDHMVHRFRREVQEFVRWINLFDEQPDFSELPDDIKSTVESLIKQLKTNATFFEIANYKNIAFSLDKIIEKLKSNTGQNNYYRNIPWLENLKKDILKSVKHTENFIERYNDLIKKIDRISNETEFVHLYNKKKQLFSVGYNIEENSLTNSYYDLLASEARQASFIAIARGEVGQKHWFKLGRTLTVIDYYKGLVSWSGTMFEYLMPFLIMKRYKNTLLDETYSFVVRSQKKYGRQRRVPWGTSESGFYSLDINLDYQYKALGVPWLGLKRGLIEDVVVAPYATMLALPVDPSSAMENIKRLKKEGLEGPYGFYEAIDYTPERLPFGNNKGIVKSFMAHHQGMSMLSLNNYLNNYIMQERFHRDPMIKAAKLLLQEKVPTDIVFTKENKEKIIPFKDVEYSDSDPLRSFHMPDPVLPKAHILSNGSYSVMLTDRGTGYSRNNNLDVTRWREDVTRDKYGMFFYIRNVETNNVWTATYEPFNIKPEKYSVTFTPDKARYSRTDDDINTQTEVVVASGDNAEIRQISLINHGMSPSVLEITSYYEVVLANHKNDIAHPAFNKLFIRTEYVPEYYSLVANRRPRLETGESLWIVNTINIEGNTVGGIQYETDRMQFIGRGRTVSNPVAMERNKPLSNTTGPVLDPILSMRQLIRIEPGETARISFVTAVSNSRNSVLELADKYNKSDSQEAVFKLALTRSRVEAHYLNLKAVEIELYQNMMSHILFISPLQRMKEDYVMNNKKGQSSLWTFGISGDFPIILVILNKMEEMDIIYEVLKAHEYLRIKDLRIDLVILNEEKASYTHPVHYMLTEVVCSSHGHDSLNRPGGVFILKGNDMSGNDRNLLYTSARVVFRSDAGYLSEQIQTIEENKLPSVKRFNRKLPQYTNRRPEDMKMCFYNGIGGFSMDGREYVINLTEGQNTPLPWVNIIANEMFGFLVTESGGGYTWFKNSREFKLTPWSNDPVTDIQGEVLYIGDSDTGELWTITPLPVRENEPYRIRHGFGYTVFEHHSHGFEQTMTQFVTKNESVKVSLIQLKNNTDEERNLTITYYVKPVLGVSDQFTSRYISTSKTNDGTVLIENMYNDEFPEKIAFIDVSGDNSSVTGNRKEFIGNGDISSPEGLKRLKLSDSVGTGFDPCGAVQSRIRIQSGQTTEILILFGVGENRQEVEKIKNMYKEPDEAHKAFDEVKNFWKSKLTTIRVETPDVSLNHVLNGWLMYQIISCRLWARSAFYQAGGAFGYRDQLQDVLPVANIWPKLTRKQILHHSRHQFKEGDVQHWWHEQNNKGTRTRFSDDYLWLPYVTAEYIRISGDRSILHEKTSFMEGPMLKDFEDEIYIEPDETENKTSIYEHCIRAIEYSLKFGKHGLPLIGSGDWNDGMNTVGNKGEGESVWLGWFLYANLMKFIPLCKAVNDDERADKYSKIASDLANAIEENAWDGSWYRRAYFDDGTPLGSVQNSECKIDSISQTWAVISGAGRQEHVLEAMNSLENYLVKRDEGLIRLLTPPFDESELEPGYIKGYVPGVRENGGQYTHAAAWVVLAFAKLGQGNKAWEMFELINPINHSRTQIEYSRYKVEPYVMPADVYSVSPHTGRGGWTWYTGSAGWVYKVGVEHILGFKKNGNTLTIDPCIPAHWNEFSIEYRFGSSIYKINITNPDGINRGVQSVTIDGKISDDKVINLTDDGQTHYVDVIMKE